MRQFIVFVGAFLVAQSQADLELCNIEGKQTSTFGNASYDPTSACTPKGENGAYIVSYAHEDVNVPSKTLLYYNFINKDTRLPGMSATCIKSLHRHHGRNVVPTHNAHFPIECSECIGEGNQPKCRPYSSPDFPDTHKGLLTPTYGNQMNKETIYRAHSCVNTIPFKITGSIWSSLEQLAFGYAHFGDAIVVTGTKEGKDSENPITPSHLWKLISINDEQGRPQVGGWIVENTEECTGQSTPRFQSFNEIVAESGHSPADVAELFLLAGAECDIPWSLENLQQLVDVKPPVTNPCTAGEDLLRKPFSMGDIVVKSTVELIRDSNIFKPDYSLALRTSFVVESFGNPNTSLGFNYQGLFGISAEILAETKTASPALLNGIKSVFGIDWATVEPVDMLKPLFGGIAFALHYQMNLRQLNPLPMTIEGAAKAIKTLLPHLSLPSETEIQRKIRDYYIENPTRGNFDMTVVMDGSGSIGAPAFQDAKEMVAILLNSTKTQSPKVRLGLVLYSTDVAEVISLSQNLSPSSLTEVAGSLVYPGGGTNTAGGLDKSTDMFLVDGLSGNPRICIVLTDGASNDKAKTVIAAARALTENVMTFSIGIGTGINNEELVIIAGGEEGHVFQLDKYTDLLEMPLWINAYIHIVPKTPGFNDTLVETVHKNDLLFYKIPFTGDGVSLNIVDKTGRTQRFFSYDFETPSAAYNDGQIQNGLTHILPREDSSGKKMNSEFIYVSVQGIEEGENDYEITFHDREIQGCGFRGIQDEIIYADPVQAGLGEGEWIWVGYPYGYEDSVHSRNLDYVDLVIADGAFGVVTNAKFENYIPETGETTLNITATFRCSETTMDYYIIIPILG